MKQLSTLTLLFFLAFCAQAQTEKGDWLIGGELGFNTVKSNSSFQFTPSAGWFFLKNVAIGANAEINFSKTGDAKFRAFGIGPFVRIYFPGDRLKPFVRGSINTRSERTEVTGFATNKENGITYFLGAGLAIFINENVALEPIAGYSSTNLKGRDPAGGFALRIGFQVYLNNDQMQVLKLKK